MLWTGDERCRIALRLADGTIEKLLSV
jgi:hypothetical protein